MKAEGLRSWTLEVYQYLDMRQGIKDDQCMELSYDVPDWGLKGSSQEGEGDATSGLCRSCDRESKTIVGCSSGC